MTLEIRIPIDQNGGKNAGDLLACASGLSKARLKEAMTKGGVWIKRHKGGELRLRRASAVPARGDVVTLYYDEQILAITPPVASLIEDMKHYSAWLKPAGLLSQGSRYSDHCSLSRQAEKFFTSPRQVFIVHRLDRETTGLMLLAHTSEAARRLSTLFTTNAIKKVYHATVKGRMGEPGKRAIIDSPLDSKKAVSEYEIIAYDQNTDTTRLAISIKTGRFHQIRRHFAGLGFPVMGDPRYGKGNKNQEGLMLIACSLAFTCPFSGRRVTLSLADFS